MAPYGVADRIQQALDAVRDALLSKHREALQRVAAIRTALDAYQAAIEEDIAADFAAKNGVADPSPRRALRAALDLRASVEALPELLVAVTREAASLPMPEPPPSRPDNPAPRRSNAPRDADSLALERDIDAVEWETIPANVFVKYAEEFAARARAIQQRVGADSDFEGRLIRRLTAMVHERGVSGVYGLSLRHTGDWSSIARRAREERQRLQAVGDGSRPLGRKLLSADDLARLARDDDDDDQEAQDEALDLPSLRVASERGAIVMVGGIVKNDKLERVRRRTGIEIEWVPLSPESSGGATSIARRVREHRVTGLVLLQGLMAHKDYEPLVEAARSTDVPVVYADKAGKGALVRALIDLDAMLTRSRSIESTAST